MQLFQDISNFSNINDYLPILNGCINTDLTALFLLDIGIIHSKFLDKWYENYKLSASILDTLILFIVIIITRFIYKYIFTDFSIWSFIGLAICVQIIHDILFYLFTLHFHNRFLSFFKGYAKNSGIRAFFGDAVMITFACLYSSSFATMNTNMNIIFLIISFYLLPFLLFGKKRF